MYLRLAIKNVFRNKKRSFLTCLSIFFAGMIVTLTEGWVNGMTDTVLRNFIQFQTGNIRITTKEFDKKERFLPVEEAIEDSGSLKKNLKKINEVDSAVERIRFSIILSFEEKTLFATGMGIEFDKDPLRVEKKIKEGSVKDKGILIGTILARKLGVKVGDSLLLATKTAQGGFNGIKLEVSGIFKYGMKLFDEKFFFIGVDQAKRLLKLKDQTTEIYVYTDNRENTDILKDKVKKILPETLKIKDYKEQMGGLYDMFQVSRFFTIIIECIILFVASFVVINTMMMSVFERMRETGTVRALGMTRANVMKCFLYEGTIIGILGGISGVICGYMIVGFFSYYGINLEPFMGEMDLPIEYVVYPSAGLITFLTASVLSIIIPAIASAYPAWYTGKIEPAVALYG